MKSLIRNINIGNIILAAAVAFFVFYDVTPLFTVKATSALPAAKKQEQETVREEQEIPIPSPAEYTVVADENLFHPERKIPVEKKEEQPLPKPDFVLYGTLITDDMRIAYMEDLKAPRNTPGRGKRQITMRKGDSLSGFSLKEIETDKVVMLRGEEKIVVPINDPAHPRTRETSKLTTTVAEKPQPTAPAKTRPTPTRAAQQPRTPPSSVKTPPSPTEREESWGPSLRRGPSTPQQPKTPSVPHPSKPSSPGGGGLFGIPRR